MWPIVPTLQCGLLRSNFSFAITQLLAPKLLAQTLVLRACGFKLVILSGVLCREGPMQL
jgi:hypothetical protein